MKKLILLTSIMMSSQVYAGFEVITPSTSAPKAKSVAAKSADVEVRPLAQPATKLPESVKSKAMIGGLTHTGRKPAIIPAAKGFGKGVTLKEAISMIVPGTFNVYNDTQIDLNRPTNWSATDGADWVSVLDQSLRNAGISATINWTESAISLEKQVITAPVIATKPEWLMTPKDKTIRNAIGRWAKTSGWNLDWDVAVDFPIPYDVSFKGDFEAAVQEVMASLVGSDYPLEACAYENKTVRIVRFGETQRCNISR